MSLNVIQMKDLKLDGQRILIRVDFNVPIKNNKVTSDARIRACLDTIRMAAKDDNYVMLMSHLGRPTEGVFNPEYSMEPVAEHLAELLGRPVRFVKSWDGFEPYEDMLRGEIVVFENVRFNKGENDNDDYLSKKMAELCDIFVMDAFGTAHRAQASTHGVAKYAQISCAGPLLCAELDALSKALDHPKKPLVAIVAGSKVSTKLTILKNLAHKVDLLIPGGGITNTFLAALGHPVGKSLYEKDLIPEALEIIKIINSKNGQLPLPTDVVVATEFSENARAVIKKISDVSPEDMILDIGPDSSKVLADLLKQAGTIVWNGPVGVFEFKNFSHGTESIAKAVGSSSAFSIAGGGDTLAAIEQFKVEDQISYISTGGGAFLEFLEGKVLPAVEILELRKPELDQELARRSNRK